MKNLFWILFLFLHFSIVADSTPIQTIHYSYGGNFKGYLNIPEKAGRMPVIIYNYDHFLDRVGEDLAKKKGYDMEAFIRVFESWGYITLIPLERYRKINAIKGAIHYARNLPQARSEEIHLVGLTEGGFLSLLLLNEVPDVTSISILVPEPIHYTGYFSLPNLTRGIDHIQTPILMIVGEREKKWRVQLSQVLHQLFKQHHKKLTYKGYPVERYWFWNPEHGFMDDIHHFVERKH